MQKEQMEKIKNLIKTKGISFATAAAIILGGMTLTSCKIDEAFNNKDSLTDIKNEAIGSAPSQDNPFELEGEDGNFPSMEESDTEPGGDSSEQEENTDNTVTDSNEEEKYSDEIHNEDFPPLDENIFGN